MRFGWATGGALVALLVAAAPALGDTEIRQVDASQYPTIRVTVVVPDKSSRPVLTVDGKTPLGLEETKADDARSIVVALDRSQSMRGTPFTAAVSAARFFLAGKPRTDLAEVIVFGHRATTISTFDHETEAANSELSRLSVDPVRGTALFDALRLAATDLRAQPLRGRTLILLTDGSDVGSAETLKRALALAERNDVLVYAIALGSADLRTLRAITQSTGGRLYRSASPATIAQEYARVSRDLGRTWRLEFPTSARPGQTLRIAVSAGGFSASRPFDVPGRTRRGGGIVPDALLGFVGITLFSVLAGGLLTGALVLAARRPRPDRVRRQLQRHLEAEDDANAARTRVLESLERSFSSSEARLGRLRIWGRIELIRDRSGIRLRTVHLLYLGVLAAIFFGLVGAVSASPPGLILLLMLAAFIAPFGVVWVLAGRRARALDAQLPDLLAAIASSLRAGHGLKHALASIAEGASPPVSEELSRVVSEARLGWPLDEALVSMCERMGSADLEFVASAVRVQSQVGGSLAGLFEMVGDTIRTRQHHARRVRTLTASGRASATILTLLPFALAGVLTLINHSYLSPLIHSGAGRLLIVISLISMTVGSLVLRRIVAVHS